MLTIGPGFQEWITEHQATPESDELFFSSELSTVMVRVAAADGSDVRMLLFYNKLTNTITPFVQATL